jgi:ribosomal protein S8
MNEKITLENYEAFYLDYLEGTLNSEDVRLFEKFLNDNPSLRLEDESLFYLTENESEINSVSRELLKQPSELTTITNENAEYAIISQKEGLLSDNESEMLKAFLAKNPHWAHESFIYDQASLPQTDEKINSLEKQLLSQGKTLNSISEENVEFAIISNLENQLNLAEKQALKDFLNQHQNWAKEAQIYHTSKLPIVKEVFEHKEALKQNNDGRIIPLWMYGSVAAAACFALFFFSSKNNPMVEGTNPQGAVANSTDTLTRKKPRVILFNNEDKFKDNELRKPLKYNEQNESSTKHHLLSIPQKTTNVGSIINEQVPQTNPIAFNEKEKDKKQNTPNSTPIIALSPENNVASFEKYPPVEMPKNIKSEIPNEDVASLENGLMYNPIPQITRALSRRLHTTIDLKKSKSLTDKSWVLKIGKIEFKRKRSRN